MEGSAIAEEWTSLWKALATAEGSKRRLAQELRASRREALHLPKPGTWKASTEGLPFGEVSVSPPPLENATEAEKVKQGVWGDTKTTLLPDAFEVLEIDVDAETRPGDVHFPKSNEEMVDKVKNYDEIKLIKESREFAHNRDEKLALKASSPIRVLCKQKYGCVHGVSTTMTPGTTLSRPSSSGI